VLYAYFRSKNSGSFGFAGPPADSTRAPRSTAAPSPNALRKHRTHTAHRCERAAGRGVGHAIRGGASQSARRSSDYLKARKARFSAGVWSACHAAQQHPAPVLCCAQVPTRHTAVSAVLGGEWGMRSGGAHRRARVAPRIIVTPTMGGREPAVASMQLRARLSPAPACRGSNHAARHMSMRRGLSAPQRCARSAGGLRSARAIQRAAHPSPPWTAQTCCGSVQKIWGYQIFTEIMCHADILGPGCLSGFDTFLIVLHKFRKCLIWSMHAALAGLKWGAAGTTSAPLTSSDAEPAPKTPSSAVRTY
jgi:hypothetical protein